MSRIFLSKADVTDVEERYVLAAMRSGWVAPLGPEVDKFESEIAARAGAAHGLALSSGTAALHLALLAIGARAGRTVIVPSMTFAASANAAVYTGADVVFVDSDGNDGNVDPELLIDAVDTLRAEGVDIAAVMSVDLFGRAADYGRFTEALAEREVPLVEDAAEALGARYDGAPAGSFGVAAGLSFNGNKIMTTSGGGMLVSNDAELIDHCRYLSTQARQPVPYYQHTDIGYNYRLSNILAALGRAQFSRLDEMIARRRSHRERYRSALASIPGVGFLGAAPQPGDSVENFWLTCITLDPAVLGIDPGGVMQALDAADIEALTRALTQGR
jgi:dTDP-4-amino-4,6-dideoxygalactose transaminase